MTVLFGLWYWFMIMRHRRWIQRTLPMLVWAAGAIALCIALIWINPVYNLLLFVMFSQIYSFLEMRWAIPVSLVLTALLALRGILVAPESWPTWVFIATISVPFSGGRPRSRVGLSETSASLKFGGFGSGSESKAWA